MTTSTFDLTPAQARFAEEHGAVAVMEGDHGALFFYRHEVSWVHRWIVSAGGRILDQAQFRRHPPKEAAAGEAPPVSQAYSRLPA